MLIQSFLLDTLVTRMKWWVNETPSDCSANACCLFLELRTERKEGRQDKSTHKENIIRYPSGILQSNLIYN